MACNYDKIREDNLREYGHGTRHLSFLGKLYTDRTHFIFELLQNAEDAGASKVLFRLLEEKLEVLHDGRLFNEKDVRGICGVGEGTKADDLTQIGKFGIGFKSVYAYTETPEIHSGDEHFKIENYVRPYAAQPLDTGDSWTTLFVFPFNKEDVEPETACREISTRLRRLSARTLLFLRNIKEVEYRLPDGTGGLYLRDEVVRGSAREVTVIGKNNGVEESESWLMFERPVDVPNPAYDCPRQVPVEIGFRIQRNEKEQREEIVKIKDSTLVVFFPTEKKTQLGFLIQGPYKTTPARDNIPKDDDWNKKLIQETAYLIVDSLAQLKSLGLISVSLLETLPIRPDDFPENDMFYPIFVAVREALKTEELLPADDGSFVSAQNAKLARGADLRDLLTSEQLRSLFNTTKLVKWLVADITQDKKPELRRYLMEQLDIEEVRPERFIDLLTDHFLENQSDEWIINFYTFLGADRTELWKKPDAPLRKRKFIRLEDNSHVTPFKSDGTPNAYLPSAVTTNFPTIKISIIGNENASDFLKNLGMIEPDLFAEIIEFILPKYAEENRVKANYKKNIEDLKKINRLLNEPLKSSLSSLAKVKILLGKLDLQEYEDYFANDEPGKFIPLLFKLVIPNIPIVRATNGFKIEYKAPSDTYKRNDLLNHYFDNYTEAWFIIDDYPDELLLMLRELGVKDSPKVVKEDADNNGFVIISNSRGYHSRGLNGFDPNIQVEGLANALASPTIEKSIFIWNKIVLPNADCIRGTIEKSSRQTYENSIKEERISESFGRLLIESKWLPGKDGKFHRPADLSLDDLPEQFERNEKLADLLGMKKDIIAKLAEEAGVQPEILKYAQALKKYPDLLEELKKRETVMFPTRSVTNRERRQKKVKEQIFESPKKEFEERQRSVRINRDAIDPSLWLREQYTNDDGQMVCQICKKEMPFKKLDGEYYFEAVEMFSKEILPREHEAQFLALCPLCAAMYKELVKKNDVAMAGFRKALLNMDSLEFPLRLGDLETTIQFVETHLCDIKTILE